MTSDQHDEFLMKAFGAFLRIRAEAVCQPERQYLLYDQVELTGPRWSMVGATLISDELRELTNNLNAWLRSLRQWHAWMMVATQYSDDERWELEHEFVAALATYCLLQPSAIRDALTLVVTNGMHQMRLVTDPTSVDSLPLDQAPWEPRKFPTRRKKEEQLASVIGKWPEGALLMERLRFLDDKQVRELTSDFRNRASHSIAPRFSRGITRTVTRSVVQATRHEKGEDGRYEIVPIPNRAVICYSVGGTDALNLDAVRQVNLRQFEAAVACFDIYVELLKKAVR